jgi:caspase domain-containing protein/YARHG domain-containing protein
MRLASTMAIALLLLTPFAPAHAETRLALVIGNSNYQHTPALPNPAHDAELMASTLASVGFDVTKVIDADQTTMKRAMVDFGRKLRTSDAVGLFYYAGHGLQVKGDNYLIPVDANISDETEVPIAGVNVNEFLETMERAQSRINIVVLDACRNNPFPTTHRSASRGLSRVEAPSGSYIAFATTPGQVAQDGDGADSPYTAALARSILAPGIPLEQVFKNTRKLVQAETNMQQTPWENSSITGDFFFVPGDQAAHPPSAPPPTPAALEQPAKPDANIEIAFWNSIKDSNNRNAFRSYLDQYPAGAFATLARLKLQELEQAAVPAPPAAANGVFPLSSTQELTAQQVSVLDCDRLWVARNEIFAREGYCFQTARGISYFGNDNCRSSSQDMLSPLEQHNVALIKSWEAQKTCR